MNKGRWDRSQGYVNDNLFNKKWIELCRDKLSDDGTIWISGTFHNIFSVAQQLTELNFHILNVVTWVKTNPPPNLSCRYFTHSTEFIIWARKTKHSSHYYNYELMKIINDGKQMRDVWHFPAIARWEKTCGKHPTQKPLAVLCRIIMASTHNNAWILDPFSGSGTTGIAACLLGRNYLGIEKEMDFSNVSKRRYLELVDNIPLFLERLAIPNVSGLIDKTDQIKLCEEPPFYEKQLLI